METEEITEGEIEITVPKLENFKTSPNEYVPSKTEVFFNPVMEFSRDISVSSLAVSSEGIDGLRACDSLSGIGARGLRYAKEIERSKKVVINDRSSKAADLIQKNIDKNGLENAEKRQKDANRMLSNHRPRFHMIDLDPFGSPIPFLDSSFTAISRRGILHITATDTGPLNGAYRNACIRRYGAYPLRNSFSSEIGLRIFIGSIQRRAVAYDLALTPILSHSTQHYFRSHFKVDQGAKKGDEIMRNMGYISYCSECGKREVREGLKPLLSEKCDCGNNMEHAGPMWVGDFSDEEHLRKVIEDLDIRDFDKSEEEIKLLKLCLEEAGGPPGFYDVHKISSIAGVSPPRFEKIIRDLRDMDYFASRTHLSDMGIRTDASVEVLKDVLS